MTKLIAIPNNNPFKIGDILLNKLSGLYGLIYEMDSVNENSNGIQSVYVNTIEGNNIWSVGNHLQKVDLFVMDSTQEIKHNDIVLNPFIKSIGYVFFNSNPEYNEFRLLSFENGKIFSSSSLPRSFKKVVASTQTEILIDKILNISVTLPSIVNYKDCLHLINKDVNIKYDTFIDNEKCENNFDFVYLSEK